MEKLFFIFLFLASILGIDLYAKDILQKKYLYELGVGFFWAKFPDYPGANHSQEIYLPYPSAIYRGEILRAEREDGVQGRIVNKKWIKIDLSMDGTFPAKSSDNPVRAGMPDLGPILEFGPRLSLYMLREKDGQPFDLSINFASRYNFSSDLKTWVHRGFSLNPFISLKKEGVFKKEDIYFFSLSVKLASKRLMDFYYQVDQIYETSFRNSFHAKSGLLEVSVAFGLFYPFKNDIWLLLGGIFPFHQNASNAGSPLLVNKSTSTLIVGLNWNFHKSKTFVYE